LTVRSPMDFVSAIESNLHHFYEFAATSANLELVKEKDYSWVRNRNSAWPNWIFRLNREMLDQEEFIKSLTCRIKNKEIPPFLVTLEPDNPEKFYALTAKYGMKQINRWTGMAITIDDYKPLQEKGKRNPILEVLNRDVIGDWISVVNSSLFNSTTLEMEIVEKLYQRGPLKLYLGYENKFPVSTSMSFETGSIAGLYMIATMETYRGKGWGTFLTEYAMEKCFQNNCRVIILHASAMGEPVYRKIGFKEYCKFGILWMVGKSYR
jgi:ribosomal protein S18 acetylase RimI-like enzyme